MKKAEQTCPEENQDQIGDAKTSTNSEMTLNSIAQKKTMLSLPLLLRYFGSSCFLVKN